MIGQVRQSGVKKKKKKKEIVCGSRVINFLFLNRVQYLVTDAICDEQIHYGVFLNLNFEVNRYS